MKKIYFILLTFLLCANSAFTSGKDVSDPICSKEDREHAEFWKDYYNPEDAFNFGELIKKVVKEKNLNKLFNLVEGELISGPRKEFVNGKKFSDLFSDNWRNSLLESKSPCSPVGWRGFMLDHGSIWFNKDRHQDKWYIFSILGAKKELISEKKLPIGWKIKEKLVPPQCFSTIWMSADNYEEFADKFAISNYKDFSKNPGKYLGKNIPNLEPITASWNNKIYLAAQLEQCFKGKLRSGEVIDPIIVGVKINKNSIQDKICSSKFSCIKYEYTILSKIPLKQCKKLAPYISGKCEESFLISVGEYSGGTMGWDMSYNIYGLFSFKDDRKFIIPLKNFRRKNDAVNYLKTIN